MEEVVGGLDIGTSSIKFVLYGKKGVVCCVSKEHVKGVAGSHELDPFKLIRDVVSLVRKAVDKNQDLCLRAIGISSFFPSLILVDSKGAPLTSIITWMDNRGQEYVDALCRDGKAVKRLHEKTGCIAHASHTMWKILWFQKNRKRLFQQAAKFLSLAEFVTYQLTGEYAVSEAIASTTGLFNIRKRQWDDEALAMAGISAQRLSLCYDLDHSFEIRNNIKKKMGLGAAARIVLGAGDGHLSNVGSGCVHSNVMCSSFGTSAALRIVDNNISDNPLAWTYCLDRTHYVQGMAINAGASTLSWFYKDVAGRSLLRLADDIASLDLQKDTGITFLPFVEGERGPGYHSGMCASFIGLRAHHGFDEMLQAVLEGIFFNLYQCYKILAPVGRVPQKIIATGGYVRLKQLLQMQADIFGKDVSVPNLTEASAAGAALSAWVAIGKIKAVTQIKNKTVQQFYPDQKCHQEYMKRYRRYLTAYKWVSQRQGGDNG